MTLAVRIGGIEFNGFVEDYDRLPGLYIGPKGVQGWSDSVDLKVDDVDNPYGPGSIELPGQLGQRSVSWSGFAVAESMAELINFRNQFRSLLSDGKFHRIVVDELGEQLWGMCQRASAPEFRGRRRPSRLFIADYLIQVRCADPRQFGQPVEGESGRLPYSETPVELINRGTYEAEPTVNVRAKTAMPNGYTLHAGDRRFRVKAPLPAGGVHVVDMATEFVTRSGVIVDKAKHSGQGWTIPSKVPTVVSLETYGGTGEFSPYFLPTYV